MPPKIGCIKRPRDGAVGSGNSLQELMMTTPVYKLLILIKRRPGMSIEDFRNYYENEHSKLGGDIGATVGMIHYVRRYLEPLNGGELEYDVLTECWFEDPAKLERVAGPLSRGEYRPEVAADEERFMDRTKTRFLKVVERETKMSGGRSH
jgi:hypothetical protein